MVIFKHTFKRVLTLKFTIIYFGIFIPVLIMLYHSFGYMTDTRDYSFTAKTFVDRHVAIFFIINFMWILGVPYLITISSRGGALIQKEIDDETLVLLVSKPITRSRIYFEKWLASFAISMLMGLLSLAIAFSIYVIKFNIDDVILKKFFGMIPGLFVYILFVNLLFTSLAMIVTSLFKHRVRAIILLAILIMAMEFIFPALKMTLYRTGTYEKYHLYLFDLNYHFGVIYYKIITMFSTIQFTPTIQESINHVIYIFSLEMNEVSDPDFNFTLNSFELINFIKPGVIFLIWSFIIALNVFISYRSLKRLDIN